MQRPEAWPQRSACVHANTADCASAALAPAPIVCQRLPRQRSFLQTVQVVRDMNAAFASPAGRAAVPSTGDVTPTLTKRLEQLRSDGNTAQLLGLDGAASAAAAAASLGRVGAAGAGAEASASGAASAAGVEQGPVAGPGGNYSWGSARMPWEVAAEGQRLVLEHVRMEDALAYIR